MKNIIYLLFALILIVSCQDETLELPRDANGNVILTEVSTATSAGVSTLDNGFTVNATLPNAKAGDVMAVECLKLQLHPEGGNNQLLPLAGTQKTVTVANDLKVSVTYTRDEAKLVNVGDYVTVTFAGVTDYALKRVDLVAATSTTKPKVSGIEIDVARTAETAYFNVTVAPKANTYGGTLVAKRKNGTNAAWVDVPGSPFSGSQPFLVPISGTDFSSTNDTMFYSFVSQQGAYTDVIQTKVIVREPYFYLKKSATLKLLSTTESGRNILINAAVPETDPNAMLALSNELKLKGGSKWLEAGKSIQFVPSSLAMYALNNSNLAIAEFEAGTPTTTADPIGGTGVYIYKMINGSNSTDVYYGMIRVLDVVPGVSVAFEYRIGNQYAHLAVIK